MNPFGALRGLGRAVFVIVLLLIAAAFFAGRANADPLTGLVHANVDGYIGALGGTGSGRTYVRPTTDTVVLACPPGTAAADCAWGKPAFAYRKFGDLAADALVNVCTVAIEPGPFAPPNRPSVDPTCGDPCGCGNALDKKANILKSAVVLASTVPPVSTTGRISLTWNAVTMCTDPTDNVIKACTNAAYPAWAIKGYRVLSGVSPTALTLLQSVDASTLALSLPDYGDGTYYFAVLAYNGDGDGERSAVASIVVKKPAAADPKALPTSVEGVTLKVTF